MAFTVAIVGRPNVGKSTLFNRLIGKRLALVDDTPGVTRDRREGDGRLSDLSFRLIDTAGLEDADEGTLEDRMRKQTEQAINEADIVLFVVDGRTGLTADDRHFGQLLRRGRTPVALVVNKCEGKAGAAGLYEAFELGFGDPIALSAEHGEGLTELYDVLAKSMGRRAKPAKGADEDEGFDIDIEGEIDEDDAEGKRPRGPLQMAVVGRPNVGKSTLINRLLGEDRLLTGPEAGITRDSIAVPYEFDGREIRLFDTAGIRRKARVQTKLEKLSVADTLRAIRYAETVVLVIDGTEGLDKQDLTIASMVVEEGRGMIIAINKWDAVPAQGEGNKQARLKDVHDRLSISLPQVRGIPVVTISGRDGRNLDGMMRAAFKLTETWNTRVPTAALNRWLEQATSQHPPPLVSGRPIRIRYATQVKARPPTFALFVSKPADLPDSYLRYLANSLREYFDLDGVPLRLIMRKGKNPYAKAD